RFVFENIAESVNEGATATKAREKMHNAATIAGMAFGNAFLGLVHAMSHVTGSTFHVAHGRTNALYLPPVIRYNGKVPTKPTSWPKQESYVAPERFQEIAKMLGLPCSTPEEAVESYASAVEELRAKVGIEGSFQEVGIDEAEFISSLDTLAMNAYEDQCAPANPRLPMLDDMKIMMEAAYYGTSFEAVRDGVTKEASPKARARKAKS
ncbi:MAG: iron-containing alcohol dehydrogenase, partial [Actinomycetota bacterium]